MAASRHANVTVEQWPASSLRRPAMDAQRYHVAPSEHFDLNHLFIERSAVIGLYNRVRN
jgi:hypothetical protein